MTCGRCPLRPRTIRRSSDKPNGAAASEVGCSRSEAGCGRRRPNGRSPTESRCSFRSGETIEAFRKFLKSRDGAEGPKAPPFSVSGVSFEGSAEANDESVTLDATLKILVNRDGEDVLVPLRLNEATLLKKPSSHRAKRSRVQQPFIATRGTAAGCEAKGSTN